MRSNFKSLLASLCVVSCLYYAAPASGDIVLSFQDILPGQGSTAISPTQGLTVIPAGFSQTTANLSPTNSNTGSSSFTFSWEGVGLDVDGDGILTDTINFDILVSSDSGNLTTNGAGLWGVAPGTLTNNQIGPDETITFEIQNISAVLSGGGPSTASASFQNFTTNGGGDSSFTVEGVTVSDGGNNIETAFTADEDFTITGDAGANFRVRAVGFELAVVTTAVPEPSSLATLIGLAGLGLIRRRK